MVNIRASDAANFKYWKLCKSIIHLYVPNIYHNAQQAIRASWLMFKVNKKILRHKNGNLKIRRLAVSACARN